MFAIRERRRGDTNSKPLNSGSERRQSEDAALSSNGDVSMAEANGSQPGARADDETAENESNQRGISERARRVDSKGKGGGEEDEKEKKGESKSGAPSLLVVVFVLVVVGRCVSGGGEGGW